MEQAWEVEILAAGTKLNGLTTLPPCSAALGLAPPLRSPFQNWNVATPFSCLLSFTNLTRNVTHTQNSKQKWEDRERCYTERVSLAKSTFSADRRVTAFEALVQRSQVPNMKSVTLL